MFIELVVLLVIAYFINETSTLQEMREALFAILVSSALMISFLCFKDMVINDMKSQDKYCIENDCLQNGCNSIN